MGEALAIARGDRHVTCGWPDGRRLNARRSVTKRFAGV